MNRLCICLCLCLLLNACGQSGRLYLPEQQPINQSQTTGQ